MNRNRSLFLLSTFLGLSLLGSAPAEERPNVLFLSIDDLRNELGCYGVSEIQTPHLDRFAESAVRFDRAYCQVAVCNPSRVSLLTGLRPDSSRVWTLDVRFRHTVPNVVTLPQHFKRSGYHTVSFGKIFHNPWPDDVSWSEPHQWPKKSRLWSEEAKQRLTRFREQMKADGKPETAIQRLRAQAVEIVDLPEEEHIDGAIAGQALEALRRLAKNKEQPFFLAAGFVRPHLPFVVPRQYWDLYDREAIPLAKNPSLPEGAPPFAMNTMYELRDYFDYLHTVDPREGSLTEDQQRELKHGYYASVSFIDALVGKLLDELETLDLARNTIVVVWSDHGWKLGEHNSWCKQTNYEIDAKVPLLIRDPRRSGNGQGTDTLVELLDLYPTLCDLAGLATPEHVEGASLRPVLDDTTASVKEAAFSQFRRRHEGRDLMGYAMRTDRYRYIEWIDRKRRETVAEELYDHRNDPGESTNLAIRSDQKATLEQLHQQLWKALPPPPPLEAKPPKPTAQKRPTIQFRNRRNETLIVSWLPEGREPKKVGEIAPGKMLRQTSTQGHRFLVEGSKSGSRKIFTVNKPNQTIHFNAPSPGAGKKSRKAKEGSPNILVLMADDWSYPHAGALGDPVVKTPTFDRLVEEGTLFDHAFVSSPSCTPSRHSVASGQYHWRLGEGANLGGSLGKNVPVYPDLLAEVGYITGFSRKGTAPSEHRFRGNDPFGQRFDNFETFLQSRDPDQPFCFWYGAGEPHRPYDWESSRDPRHGIDHDAMEIPPIWPDNETTRTDLGDYYVKVQRFDRDAGRMIAMLEESGDLENTIVVMTGDNGMPFPRAKATLYDLGTRVPLVIRWGAQFHNEAAIGDFVSLTDLAPTFLEAAGLKIPREMTGASLLEFSSHESTAPRKRARDTVLTGMERHVYPYPARAIRSKDLLYIRNFAPAGWPTGKPPGEALRFDFRETPWPTVPGAFAYNVDPGPTKQWMREHGESGEHAPLFQLSFGRRPSEELYDLRKDPHQLTNLAGEPEYQASQQRLARRLARDLRKSGDPRFALPEHTTFDVRGWTIHLNDAQWESEPEATDRMLELLVLQLDRVIEVVPKKALAQLREVPIWINPPYDGFRPSAEYHPDGGWLERNGRNPDMAKTIEITNVSIFPFENRRMPYVLLHELAHAYHDRILGFDREDIVAAFERARDSGSYEEVERFNGRETVLDRAYALSDHKEYFAELTEAYFGKNDFYPFDRTELKAHDPQGYEAIQKAWGAK